ncbi:class A beta-lactamase-related serine hydrolase [Streptomyces kasugaensis]|uniref:Class A beta-lactamase-related serine hydrolase n=1 Tax=Streptomyces kasugaensis TaxID=1946 RepID=A0A4Q9HS87_STRKA|nr:serine hydrolase domain-containing protein [Streptomyces kasugaensis]TBO57893.1 class A beta-lactamase-related serine hydrolase [Streptomyces kasugaensis]
MTKTGEPSWCCRAVAAVAAGVVAVLSLGASPPAAAAQPVSGYGGAVLRHDLDALHDRGVAGVLGEVRDGPRRLIARSGVAEVRTGRPVPYRGYFRMGSNAKTFTAVVVLQLAGAGRLSLDDPVAKWLPGMVARNGNDGRKITVRNLLQHTSGLYDYADDLAVLTSADGYHRHRFDTYRPEQLVALAMRHRPHWVPGAGERRWGYSNTDYVLAGLIIERATGRSWAGQIRDRILRPLGLRHTFSPGTWPYLPEPHAEGYTQFTKDGPLVDTTVLNPSLSGGAGDLITTTGDLMRFWQALLDGRLLRPAQLLEMKRTVDAVPLHSRWPGARVGLGIMRFRLTCEGRDRGWYWTHDGGIPGYSTRNGFSEDGRRGIVLSLSTVLRGEPAGKAGDLAIAHALCGGTDLGKGART